MKFAIIVIIFLSALLVDAKCPCAREALKDCFSTLLDVNNDGSIELSELNTTMTQMMAPHGCFADRTAEWKQRYTASFIMESCDVDKNNNLTESDWDSPQSCDASATASYWICMFCSHCGWHPPS